MRGFLGGVSAGALLAAGGVAMLSLSVPLPNRVQQGAPSTAPAADGAASQDAQTSTGDADVTTTDTAIAPEITPEPEAEPEPEQPAAITLTPREHLPGDAPTLSEGPDAGTDAPASGAFRDADLAGAEPTSPVAAQTADDLSALAPADRDPASKPEVDQTAAAPDAPDIATASVAPSEATPSGEHQPDPTQPGQPTAPGDEAAVEASTEPAPEPSPEPREQVAQEAEVTAPTAEPEPEPEPEADRPAAVGLPSQSAVVAPDIGTAPQATTLPVIGAAPRVPESSAAALPKVEAEAQDDSGEAGDTQATLAPQIGTPVVPLTDRDDPQDAPAAQGDNMLPPFAAYSEPFENPEGKPLMSIVLIEDIGSVGVEALAEFPYPLSFAINPEDPQASAKMAARRAAGFEVLMLTDLPREAAPQDAETALEVWRGRLPEAVAILEGVETGVQGNRPLADQVAAVAASVGYGLVTQNSGLNTVQKLALRDGVPAGVVFRDFDGAGQNPRAIRRFLDQAAFRAGQEGAVIMLGRLRADTISALLSWGLQDRAGRVALAPVSASLKAKLPPE